MSVWAFSVDSPSRTETWMMADVLVAGDAPLEGPQRHEDEIVLIRAHGALALGLQQADHLAGELAQADRFPERVLPPKSFLRTVAPMMQTAAPARSSLSVNCRPVCEASCGP